MSDRRDPRYLTDEAIARWILDHPDVWADGSSPISAVVEDAAIADIVSGGRQKRLENMARRSRRIGGGVVGAMLLVGGAVGVAAISRSGQPRFPASGIACRAGSEVDSEVIVIDPTSDPVTACAGVWAEGRFERAPSNGQAVPSLMACISNTGVIEVYPGDAATCGDLGLAEADDELDDETQSLLSLEDRVISEINAKPCTTATAVAAVAQQLIHDGGFTRWRVEIRSDSVAAGCAKAAVDPVERVVLIVKFP